MDPDPELLAALELAAQFIARTLNTPRHWPPHCATAGARPRPELQAITERIASDQRDLERFSERLRQLRAMQRPH